MHVDDSLLNNTSPPFLAVVHTMDFLLVSQPLCTCGLSNGHFMLWKHSDFVSDAKSGGAPAGSVSQSRTARGMGLIFLMVVRMSSVKSLRRCHSSSITMLHI